MDMAVTDFAVAMVLWLQINRGIIATVDNDCEHCEHWMHCFARSDKLNRIQ